MGLALRLAFLAPFACGNHGGTPWWKEEAADARRCTSRGREVACLDVSTCARGAAKKVAIASATCGEANRTRCDNGTAVGHRLKLAALGRRAGVDVILVVPRRDLQREPIDAGVARRLAEGGVKPRRPLESGGCCGAREFMKLHAFGFADYDAVAVVDNDFDVDDVERLRPIFDCAAAGHGFIYWFFYQNFDDPRWKPVQVDPCVWNVQAFLAQMCKAEICASASVAAGHIGLMDQTRRALDCAKGGGG
ncbi:hypothetical protein JL722_13091 [Aureococcus anophagefferens]|nr:hypothetical protein JL722_13091 [Aureococcus anophagefferens]